MRFCINGILFNGHARIAAKQRVINNHTFARAGGKRIHQFNHRIGVFLKYHVPRHTRGSIRTRKRRRENQPQHSLALFRMRFKRLGKISRRNLRRGARLARTQSIIKRRTSRRIVKWLRAGLPRNRIRKRKHLKLGKAGGNLRIQIRTGIRQNCIHCYPFSVTIDRCVFLFSSSI